MIGGGALRREKDSCGGRGSRVATLKAEGEGCDCATRRARVRWRTSRHCRAEGEERKCMRRVEICRRRCKVAGKKRIREEEILLGGPHMI